ncbi:ferric reductase transmembrane component 4 [Polyplosphaeria fusca]|uniref:Ferric reductase transmembrane component 4 n=1 Tax=Polyplosphaeria fusca TaxID=682080 RepID=A0A9P4QK21_9PLEO|nr:ferric reductase transmembrane component 4 [Polyplosphaeria fusca]
MRLLQLSLHAVLAACAFEGLGGPSQEPSCAYACGNVLGSAELSCSEMMHMHGHMMPLNTPACLANNDAFLTSLAFCISQHCPQDTPLWQLEQYWAMQATGAPGVLAKWGYQTALGKVDGTPGATWGMGVAMNETMRAPEQKWYIWNAFLGVMKHNSILLYEYSLVLLVVGFVTPIALTYLTKLPGANAVLDRVNPYLVWPSTVGRYHVRSLPWSLGNPPNMGQAFYIGGFVLLNIIFSCLSYSRAPQPHPWGYDRRGEILAYAGYRTGEFAFALLPLLILFAGRNNILLWMTNWSHSTFILLHRWVARLFTIHTVLHSVFLWAARVQTGTYSADVKLPYWQWGIVGTVFCCIMTVFSLLWMRRFSYEVFLIGHIIMAIFTIVGSWYHVILRFGKTGSHEYWLYAAFAVWAFDRILRVLRIVKNGVRRANITEVGTTHVRVEIPGIRFSNKPGHHGYVYFPTLNPLKPWENHPFSVNSTTSLRCAPRHLASPATSIHGSGSADDKHVAKVATAPAASHASTTSGITLYVRKSTGMTKLLQQHESLITLLDGPYHNNTPSELLSCDRLLLIGGGIGITGLLGFVGAHPNIKLAWSMKQIHEAVARDLAAVVDTVADREVRIGERLEVKALVQAEAQAGYGRVGVVVCGPGELCDDVRGVVASVARHSKTRFDLEVDAFGW